ncbi:MAG: thioredoxin domain-containing protein [Gemmatimonadota bacterium]
MTRLIVPVNEHDHVQGDATAPATLVEYGDYECPHCGRAHPIVKRVQHRLGRSLRFVFRNFPLSEIHPHAEHAAEAAESVAAHAGSKPFWAMHDLIFEHQDELGDRELAQLAKTAGGDGKAVLADLETARFRDRVKADFMSGVRSGVNGTPTFFINGVRHDGPWDEESLVAALVLAAETAPA